MAEEPTWPKLAVLFSLTSFREACPKLVWTHPVHMLYAESQVQSRMKIEWKLHAVSKG